MELRRNLHSTEIQVQCKLDAQMQFRCTSDAQMHLICNSDTDGVNTLLFRVGGWVAGELELKYISASN